METIWSSTRIDYANYCRMKYFLRYVDKEEGLTLSVYAKGSCWPSLGTEGEVAKNRNKKKYFDAESFGKYAERKWLQRIVADQRSKNKIEWTYPDEKWVIRSTLPLICKSLYDILFEEGPPLFSELKFKFYHDGKRFRGRIDEVRVRDRKVVIRDYKSGKPWLGNIKIDHDPQLTLYNVGLCSLCFTDKRFSEKIGISDEERRSFMGNPILVNPLFSMEFFMIEAPYYNSLEKNRSLDAILSTSRSDNHFYEIIEMINGTISMVNSGRVYPEWGRKCDYCDMKVACEKKAGKPSTDILINKEGQLSLSLMTPPRLDLLEEDTQTRLRLRRNLKGKN